MLIYVHRVTVIEMRRFWGNHSGTRQVRGFRKVKRAASEERLASMERELAVRERVYGTNHRMTVMQREAIDRELGKATATLMIEGIHLNWNGWEGEVVFVNERLLKDGWPDDAAAYPVHGDCLSPQVLPGDMVLVAHNQFPKDGDIVALSNENGRLVQRYREIGEDAWLESAHGKMALDGCSIIGVVVLIGRSVFTIACERSGFTRIF